MGDFILFSNIVDKFYNRELFEKNHYKKEKEDHYYC